MNLRKCQREYNVYRTSCGYNTYGMIGYNIGFTGSFISFQPMTAHLIYVEAPVIYTMSCRVFLKTN